jgi:hypothetical protein
MFANVMKLLGVINTIGSKIALVEAGVGTAMMAINGVTAGVGVVMGGKDKTKLVESQVMAALEASEFLSGRDIVNEKEFRKHLRNCVKSIVGMLNASVWQKA